MTVGGKKGEVCKEMWKWPTVRECPHIGGIGLRSPHLSELTELSSMPGLPDSWLSLHFLTHCFQRCLRGLQRVLKRVPEVLQGGSTKSLMKLAVV